MQKESIKIPRHLVERLRKLKIKTGRFMIWHIEQALEKYLTGKVK